MTKDYYKILGVEKNATKEDIKKAYKRLAKQYHPDLNSDSEAENKFKEINEAASVLADEKKREQYDNFGTADSQFSSGFSGFDFRDFMSDAGVFDFDDVFESFFGGSGQRSRSPERGGSDLMHKVEITLEEAASGAKKSTTLTKSEVCSKCNGTGAKTKSDIAVCPDCNGTGYARRTTRTPFGIFSTTTNCGRCRSTGKIIKERCAQCNGSGTERKTKKIEIEIPAGIEDGMRLRIKGEGEAGRNAKSGDLYVLVHVKQHEIFERDGDDLHIEVPISFAQAALGAEIDVPTLKGNAKLKIPAGTQTNTVFRMKGKGVPSIHGYNNGDENVKVTIETPQNLTKKQKELLKEFDSENNTKKGFFSKIKDTF